MMDFLKEFVGLGFALLFGSSALLLLFLIFNSIETKYVCLASDTIVEVGGCLGDSCSYRTKTGIMGVKIDPTLGEVVCSKLKVID